MRLPRDPGNPHFHCALGRVLVALALAATLLPTGCVRRRLAVRSNPPGALVFVDNQQIGTTPCSVDFTYYGTREIRLEKAGFETLTVNQPIPTPWYQIPPLDFVSENVVPNKIEDHRTVSFDLQPQVIVPTEQLLDRANQLRQETLSGAATPPAAIGPTALPPVTQSSPLPTFSPPAFSPPFSPLPGTPGVGVPSTAVPSTAAPSLAPSTTPYSASTLGPSATFPGTSPATPAPFSAPALPAAPPNGTQQGPPIVSPPLR